MQAVGKGYLKRLTVVVLLVSYEASYPSPTLTARTPLILTSTAPRVDPHPANISIVESYSMEFVETAFSTIKTLEELRNAVYASAGTID